MNVTVVIGRTRLSDTVYGLTTDYGRQLWTRVKLRKSRKCGRCSKELNSGNDAYSPVTNGYNRMERLCPECVET